MLQIFIQKFKEFKFYDKNFHLNLNLLPTSLSEFFDVFKTQNTKEEINNYLNFVYLINNILINLEVTNLNSYLAVSEDHEFKDYFGHSSLPYITAINSKKKNIESDIENKYDFVNTVSQGVQEFTPTYFNKNTKDAYSAGLNSLPLPQPHKNGPYYLNKFKKIKGLIENDTHNYIKMIQDIKALEKLEAKMAKEKKKEEEKIKREE